MSKGAASKKTTRPAKKAEKPAAKAKKKRKWDEAAARERVEQILPVLKGEYPDARCRLDHQSPLQLLVATILSAQCTDDRVNMVTPGLFKKYPTAQALADVSQEDLETEIQSTGFFRNKAKSIRAMAASLIEQHEGDVPGTMEQLVELAGVGRKTANVVLGNAFGVDEGVVVDTHVQRLSGRLGLSLENTPEKIERDLMKVVPQAEWTLWSHLMIHHGRKFCVARKPKCEGCPLAEWCPSYDEFTQVSVKKPKG